MTSKSSDMPNSGITIDRWKKNKNVNSYKTHEIFDIAIEILRKTQADRDHDDIRLLTRIIEKLDFLHDIELKKPIHQHYIRMGCCEALQYQHYHSGMTIFNIDDPSDKVYIILKGSVNIYTMRSENEVNNDIKLIRSQYESLYDEYDVLDEYRDLGTASHNQKKLLNHLKDHINFFEILGGIDFNHLNDIHHYFQNGIFKYKYETTINQGNILGNLKLPEDKPRGICVIAKDDTYLAVLFKEDYEKITSEIDKGKLDQKIDFFRDNLCGAISYEAVLRFSKLFKKEYFKMNQVIYKVGELTKFFYLIKKGSVHICQETQDITQIEMKDSVGIEDLQKVFKPKIKKSYIPIKILSYGQIFGEEVLLKNPHRKFCAISMTAKTKVYRISKEEILKYLNIWPTLHNELYNRIAKRTEWMNDHMQKIKKIEEYRDMLQLPAQEKDEQANKDNHYSRESSLILKERSESPTRVIDSPPVSPTKHQTFISHKNMSLKSLINEDLFGEDIELHESPSNCATQNGILINENPKKSQKNTKNYQENDNVHNFYSNMICQVESKDKVIKKLLRKSSTKQDLDDGSLFRAQEPKNLPLISQESKKLDSLQVQSYNNLSEILSPTRLQENIKDINNNKGIASNELGNKTLKSLKSMQIGYDNVQKELKDLSVSNLSRLINPNGLNAQKQKERNTSIRSISIIEMNENGTDRLDLNIPQTRVEDQTTKLYGWKNDGRRSPSRDCDTFVTNLLIKKLNCSRGSQTKINTNTSQNHEDNDNHEPTNESIIKIKNCGESINNSIEKVANNSPDANSPHKKAKGNINDAIIIHSIEDPKVLLPVDNQIFNKSKSRSPVSIKNPDIRSQKVSDGIDINCSMISNATLLMTPSDLKPKFIQPTSQPNQYQHQQQGFINEMAKSKSITMPKLPIGTSKILKLRSNKPASLWKYEFVKLATISSERKLISATTNKIPHYLARMKLKSHIESQTRWQSQSYSKWQTQTPSQWQSYKPIALNRFLDPRPLEFDESQARPKTYPNPSFINRFKIKSRRQSTRDSNRDQYQYQSQSQSQSQNQHHVKSKSDTTLMRNSCNSKSEHGLSKINIDFAKQKPKCSPIKKHISFHGEFSINKTNPLSTLLINHDSKPNLTNQSIQNKCNKSIQYFKKKSRANNPNNSTRQSSSQIGYEIILNKIIK